MPTLRKIYDALVTAGMPDRASTSVFWFSGEMPMMGAQVLGADYTRYIIEGMARDWLESLRELTLEKLTDGHWSIEVQVSGYSHYITEDTFLKAAYELAKGMNK